MYKGHKWEGLISKEGSICTEDSVLLASYCGSDRIVEFGGY